MTVLASPDVVELVSSGVVCAANQLFICDLSGHVTKTLRKRAGNFFVRQNVLVAQTASTFRVFDLRTGKQKSEFTPRGYHTLCGVTRDGKRILTKEFAKLNNRAFSVWDLSSKKEAVTFTEKKSFVVAATISDDGALVVHGGTDGVARFFDVASTKQIARVPTTGWIEAAASFGDTFAVGGRAGVVSILSREAEIERTLSYGAKIAGIALSERFVVAYGTKSAPTLWDLSSRVSVPVDHHDVAGLLGGTRCARFSSDGTRIITCGNDCRVVVSKIEL
jgi:WD40 repeat protein